MGFDLGLVIRLAPRNFQQLIGMQLCPIPQQQWLATQNVLCIVCYASDVRHFSALDLVEQFQNEGKRSKSAA